VRLVWETTDAVDNILSDAPLKLHGIGRSGTKGRCSSVVRLAGSASREIWWNAMPPSQRHLGQRNVFFNQLLIEVKGRNA
jgi:hypothetical protein